jgi:hypothetical protein
MRQIPLKVLIVDANEADIKALYKILKTSDAVLSVDTLQSTEGALKLIDDKDINAIYIDPLTIGIELASDFTFSVREQHPPIVFVLYLNSDQERAVEDEFYSGDRKRLRHYFKLDKKTPGPDFWTSVLGSIESCQRYLSRSLTRETIERLRAELSKIQNKANPADQSVSVPLSFIQQIQEQLNARQKEAESPTGIIQNADFLGPPNTAVESYNVFVIMPYSEQWSEAAETIIKNVCRETDFEFKIAKTMDGRFVPQDIWKGITGATVIIADLTGANANVAYEIGLADAIGREVILICQETKVPFDFLGQRLVVYQNTMAGGITLGLELTKKLQRIRDRRRDMKGTDINTLK